jgi:hypothetical protein
MRPDLAMILSVRIGELRRIAVPIAIVRLTVSPGFIRNGVPETKYLRAAAGKRFCGKGVL